MRTFWIILGTATLAVTTFRALRHHPAPAPTPAAADAKSCCKPAPSRAALLTRPGQ